MNKYRLMRFYLNFIDKKQLIELLLIFYCHCSKSNRIKTILLDLY